MSRNKFKQVAKGKVLKFIQHQESNVKRILPYNGSTIEVDTEYNHKQQYHLRRDQQQCQQHQL